MTLGEIGDHFPLSPSRSSLTWYTTDKINQVKGDSVATRTYLHDLLYGMVVEPSTLVRRTFYNSAALKVIETAHSKRGCDVNKSCELPGLPLLPAGSFQMYS